MRMQDEGLPPGVQHGEEPNSGAETGGVGSDSQQCFRDRAEQQVVNHARVLEGKLSERIREGEDYVVVGHREQFALASFKPLGFGQRLALGTVAVAARVINGELMSALIALVEMPAERGCSTLLDCAQHSTLGSAGRMLL